MSALEIVEAFSDALGRGDRTAVSALLHPAVRWVIPTGFPGGQEHRGKPAVERHLFEPELRFWETIQTRIDSMHEADDLVFVRGALVTRVHARAQPHTHAMLMLFEVRAGMIEVVQLFTDTAMLRDVLRQDPTRA